MALQQLCVSLFVCAAAVALVATEQPSRWPQFRGPNANGLASTEQVPVVFGPDKAVAWKRPLPSGHSSPAVWGDRIFVTGFDHASSALQVLGLSTKDGALLWVHSIPVSDVEQTHPINGPATPTPTVDAAGVYAYFGSYGVVALTHRGKVLWAVPLPRLTTQHGSDASPIVHSERLILNRDAMHGGYLLALDRRSGKTSWKADYRPGTGRATESHSTPVVWRNQVIVHRSGFVEAYDLQGRRVWWVEASTNGTSTALAGSDAIYVATWSNMGEADQVPPPPDFPTLLKKYDADGNGQISQTELPPTLYVNSRPDVVVPGSSRPFRAIFPSMDQDGDGLVNRGEWERAVARLSADRKDHGVVAIKPDGEGDLTSRITWREKTGVPEVPSPLLYEGRLYLIRNGGILSCLDAETGALLYRTRIGAPGAYFSSPVASKGAIFFASAEGVVTILAPGETFQVRARNDLVEPIYATPAIAGGTIYVRTAGHLYAFR